MSGYKISKIQIIMAMFICFWQGSSFGQFLNDNQDIPFSTDINTVSDKIFPILGMPITLFQILSDNQNQRILKNIVDVCNHVDAVYKKLSWGISPCLSLPWKYDYVSEVGTPLLYWEYSSENADHELEKKNTTIILGGVHADELTPVHMAFKIAQTLHDNPITYKDVRVIIAPLVNPDGFFAKPFKRTNANGVDLNRNFPTKTWDSYAMKEWFQAKKRDSRKFPGYYANSEQGTRFQMDLIKRFKPDRIISIHAPLAFLDLDFDNKRW